MDTTTTTSGAGNGPAGVDPDAIRSRVRDAVGRTRADLSSVARAAQRDPDEVTIVAAVKYADALTVAALVGAGITDLAENRLDHQAATRAAVPAGAPITWHYIGRLQSRTAPAVAASFDVVHTLASASAAARIARARESVPAGSSASEPMTPTRILVQVNVDADPAKDGVSARDAAAFLDALPDEIVVAGLMTMPAAAPTPEHSRQAFELLRALRDDLAVRFSGRHDVTDLSMGTTQDWRVAVELGATHVRLGRTLTAASE